MNWWGFAAAVTSLSVIFIGFPSQVWKNYVRKSTEGLDNRLVWTALVAYSTWLAYGVSGNDWFLIISQTPGVICTLFLVSQIFIYRKKN